MKFLSYPMSLARWTAAGCPTRTDAHVADLLTTQCKKCFLYDRQKKRCRECGCAVSLEGWAIVNKVKMATESCPLGRW